MVYRERRPDGTTRLIGGGGSGDPGPPGDQGPPGPAGTRWGFTDAWAFADPTDVACEMADGDPPRVGDVLVSTNGIAYGEVYKITAVYETTNNVDIEYEGTIRGPEGPKGDATRWWYGAYMPDATNPDGAAEDDFFLRSTGQVYQKTSGGTWSAITNLKGPQGDPGNPGTPGSQWLYGTTIPSAGSPVANSGDWYFRYNTADIYRFNGTSWSFIVNIKGIQGDPGTPGASGSRWYDGNGAPSSGLGTIYDYYLDLSNGDVYDKASGFWQEVGNIKGVAGGVPADPQQTHLTSALALSGTTYQTHASVSLQFEPPAFTATKWLVTANVDLRVNTNGGIAIVALFVNGVEQTSQIVKQSPTANDRSMLTKSWLLSFAYEPDPAAVTVQIKAKMNGAGQTGSVFSDHTALHVQRLV